LHGRARSHSQADPGNTTLGHNQVQRQNLPEGWVISRHPAHAGLVSEADFIAAQDTVTPRGQAGPAARPYLLAGLLACGRCGRRLESAWSTGRPAYRCRHGHTSATAPGPGLDRGACLGAHAQPKAIEADDGIGAPGSATSRQQAVGGSSGHRAAALSPQGRLASAQRVQRWCRYVREPRIILIIFAFMRTNRQSCQGTKVRMNIVHRVGRVT